MEEVAALLAPVGPGDLPAATAEAAIVLGANRCIARTGHHSAALAAAHSSASIHQAHDHACACPRSACSSGGTSTADNTMPKPTPP